MDVDSLLGNVLFEEIGIFKDLGFIWPKYDSKMIAYSVVYFTTLIYFVITSYTTFFFLQDDLHTFFLSINYSLLLHLAVSLPFLWKRSRNDQTSLYLMVANGFHEYQVPTSVSLEIHQRVKKEIYIFILVLIASTTSGGIITFSSTIDSYFGEIHKRTSDYISYNLPIHMWVPFKLHQSFWWMVALAFYQGLIIFFVALTILSSELLYVKFCQKIYNEQEILIWSLQNLKKRAQQAIEGVTAGGNPTLDFRLDLCLTENIRHHQKVKRFTLLYSKVLGPMLLSAWFLGTTAIALSLYEAVQGTVSFGKILTSASLAIAEVLNVFVLSRMGQHVVDLEEQIFNEACFLPWLEFSISTRRRFLTFLTGTRKPDVLRAGNLIAMNYDSFANAMNTAYSFFSVLNASKIS